VHVSGTAWEYTVDNHHTSFLYSEKEKAIRDKLRANYTGRYIHPRYLTYESLVLLHHYDRFPDSSTFARIKNKE
jgi:hypothetical protein